MAMAAARTMTAARLKREYGPSMARPLALRWRAASPPARAVALLAVLCSVGALVAVGLTLENARYSHGGEVPFSFEYRDLYRVAPDSGGYVKVQSRFASGALKYSYAVDRLKLPPYAGAPQAEMPLYAGRLIGELSARYEDFVLRGEGKTKINNTLIGYELAFTAVVHGRKMYARDVLLLPGGAHPRAGVTIAMLASPAASATVDTPLEVAQSGVLLRPLKTFAFG
jgi:hypothetical protein